MRLTRRNALRGLQLGAGAALLGPALGAWLGEARGQAPQRRRLVVFLEGGGWETNRHKPASTDSNSKILELNRSSLLPLTKHLPILSVIDNLRRPFHNAAAGGHSELFSALSCLPNEPKDSDNPQPGGPTIDSFIASQVGQADRLPLLALGVLSDKGMKDMTVRRLACTLASAPREAIPYIVHPETAREVIFGLPQLEVSTNQPLRRRLLTDFLVADIARLRGKLAGTEQRKLDRYADQLRALDTPVATPSTECLAPQAAGGITLRARIEDTFRHATAALICRQTHMVSIGMTPSNKFLDATYDFLGYTKDNHALNHGGNDPDLLGNKGQIFAYHAGLLAKLCDDLAAVPEGSGTMLDNTLVLWVNDNGAPITPPATHPFARWSSAKPAAP